MDKRLELEAKELLYSNIADKVEESIDNEKIIQYKSHFFESVDLEVIEDDEDKRIIFVWKDKWGKCLSINNIKLNIFRLLEGIAELYVGICYLNESNLCCIIHILKTVFEVCELDLSEEYIVIILAIYYEVRMGEQITDSNLCDKVNLYAENYMGIKLPTSRINKIICDLYDKGIVEIDNEKFSIGDYMIVIN